MDRVEVVGEPRERLAAEDAVLGMSSIREDAVDVLLLARDEVAAATRLTDAAVTSVPSRTDVVSDFEPLFALADLDDASGDFVTFGPSERRR